MADFNTFIWDFLYIGVICGSVGSHSAWVVVSPHPINRWQLLKADSISVPSLLTSTVNAPSLNSRLIQEFDNAPVLQKQGSNSPGWHCPASTCSPGPVPTHKEELHTFTPSATAAICNNMQPRRNPRMLVNAVNFLGFDAISLFFQLPPRGLFYVYTYFTFHIN